MQIVPLIAPMVCCGWLSFNRDGASASADNETDEISAQMKATFVCGSQRTATQHLRFVINQLVEVAMRALSPGVNDSLQRWTGQAAARLASVSDVEPSGNFVD